MYPSLSVKQFDTHCTANEKMFMETGGREASDREEQGKLKDESGSVPSDKNVTQNTLHTHTLNRRECV